MIKSCGNCSYFNMQNDASNEVNEIVGYCTLHDHMPLVFAKSLCVRDWKANKKAEKAILNDKISELEEKIKLQERVIKSLFHCNKEIADSIDAFTLSNICTGADTKYVARILKEYTTLLRKTEVPL